jgi:single-stranded DNA-specific DHH superfamily exonuclease
MELDAKYWKRNKMKYLNGSKKEFDNFVKSISKKDKVNIITHTDLDGIASGIFLQKILESKNLKLNSINFLDYGASVLKDYSEKNDFDYLFISDWNADESPEGLNLLRKNGKVLVIDHHPMNEKLDDKSGIIKTESKDCSAHCIFDFAKNYFDTKNLEWLVCSAIIMDYCWMKDENFNFIKSVYPKTTKEDIWNSEPGKIGKQIANALIYYSPDFEKVYDLVLKKDFKKLEKADETIQKEIVKWKDKFRKEAEYFPEKKLYFYYENPKYKITSVIVSEISQREKPNDSLIFVSDNPNEKNSLKLSARNQSGNVDLGKVLKKCVEGFENSSAGGHVRASAANFPKKYLNEFKKRLMENL